MIPRRAMAFASAGVFAGTMLGAFAQPARKPRITILSNRVPLSPDPKIMLPDCRGPLCPRRS
jgi:hypothetical protein